MAPKAPRASLVLLARTAASFPVVFLARAVAMGWLALLANSVIQQLRQGRVGPVSTPETTVKAAMAVPDVVAVAKALAPRPPRAEEWPARALTAGAVLLVVAVLLVLVAVLLLVAVLVLVVFRPDLPLVAVAVLLVLVAVLLLLLVVLLLLVAVLLLLVAVLLLPVLLVAGVEVGHVRLYLGVPPSGRLQGAARLLV